MVNVCKSWRCWIIMAFVCALTGCIESDDHFILNPDGSGKLEHQVKFVTVNFNMGGGEKSAREKAQQAVRKLLTDSKGIDAWKDVSYAVLPDGRVEFKGVAYFKDISQVQLKHGGSKLDLLEPAFHKENGQAILEFNWSDSDKASKKDEVANAAAGTEQLTNERAKYQQMKPMLAAMFGNMRITQKFTLPGTVESVTNLEQQGNAVVLDYAGTDMMEAIDGFISDDQWLLQQLNAGKNLQDGFTPDASLNEKIFGTAGDVKATVAVVGQAPFDYASEMEAALHAMPAMLEQLGLKGAEATTLLQPAAAGEGFKELLVGGIRVVRDVGDDSIRPFNWNPGLSVSLTGTFAGSVLEVKEGIVTEAESMAGENLMPESEFNRTIRFPNVSEDGTKTTFEINLEAPGQPSPGMRKLAGTLEYWISKSTREVDLELTTLATGTQSSALGGVIGEYTEQNWGGKTQYEAVLDLDVAESQVKEVRFLDAKGNHLAGVSKSGHSGFNDSVSMNFRSEKPFPPNGNIIVVLYDGIEKFEIPFEIGPFDWLGLPITE